MKIKREKLLNDLQDFAMRGNGVIIGSPGIGKTYLLKELYYSLESLEIPQLILPIDQLGDGTDETLQSELSYEGDLIERLKSVPVSDQKAILLFDAFDAARDEGTRKNFLRLIQRAVRELKDSWNVIVTVRTYDAKKSQELLDLFGNLDNNGYHSENILCRHFTIPPFNKDEILQVFDQIGCPKSIYNEGSQDFKNILSNPFNLWLMERIIQTSKNVPDFSHIRSEVQLLDLFWQRRIENEKSEHLLRQIADKMVQERSLSVRVSDVYDDVDLDKPIRKNAWDKLQSNEILSRVSSSGQRIAFSHNILFDYAISVLLIEDEPQQLENFILQDASRPLFLRPSLTYFFTRLWYYDSEDSESFWKAFWHIFPSDQSVHLRLVARLIPTSVIANEARGIEQLIPLLEELGNGEKGKIANEAVTRLSQALQTLQIKRDTLWINFFDQASRHLHENFAWDLANLTSAILERVSESEKSEVVNACGRIGRRLLKWVWQKREAGKSTWYDRFGGRWAVPLVAQTYHTNPEESRMLLEKILELPKEDNFPITFLSWLTEHVNRVWEYDPEFVTLIYRTVFHHNESSDAKTSLSGGVLAMTSTRRQDYSMCRYRLIKHFPGFLQEAPLSATLSVIRSLNVFIVGEHIARYLKADVKLEDIIEIFNFRGKPAYFMEDGSYMWDARNSSDEPIEMADALFEFIAELAKSEDAGLDSLLDVFRNEVIVAFFWKRLLGTASQFPKIFTPYLFELCIAKPILRGNDARYELGQFLEAAAPEFSSDQLRRLEESILMLPQEATDEDSHNALVYRRNRLLERIPEGLLITDEAKRIRKKMMRENDIQKNRPLVSFSTQTEAVTDKEWFQRQGVDITKSANQDLQRFSAPLNKFSSDWMNGVPTVNAAKLVLPQLQKAYTAVKSNTEADKEMMNSLWHKLAACVAILGRIANKLENSEFSFCREILLEAAKHEEPKLNPRYDDQFDSPGYSPYSPCARHEAASGLLRFTFYQPDTEMLDAIETLASDPVPSVRMVTAMELFLVYNKAQERFWRIMNNRAIHEPKRVVQKFLYYTLTRVITREKENEDKITRVMAKLLAHTPPPTEGLEPSDSFTVLLMWLAIDRQNAWAFKTLKETYFKDPIRFANPLSRAVSEVVKEYVLPKHLEMDEGRETAKRAIQWLGQVIDLVSDEIKELHRIVKEDETEENVKKLHDTYKVIDEVITRLYFAVAYKRDRSKEPVAEISHELRCDYYAQVRPLMQQVIAVAQDPTSGIMFAPTAHYFMQLLRSFLGCNPKEVLHLATGVVQSSERFGYTLDSLAVREVVEFVEIVLADYRHEVRDGEALEDLLNLLDLFAKIGWSDALKLVWRLDEVFR
ncbi:NACHT domain-containing protein [Candidatus Poribacteria bacterium]|nr:NACHT domain-containing protein [Candidatus Poribacteria bacterium]MYK96586.1 NACHT domain-containing protein [Candidatus Poribacteria bacterium]